MLTDNRADYRTQDWFLIACEGDLVLKLARDLMIGEDERGQTVLSPAREDALLRITSENGCLTLQAMAMDWTFSEEGGLSLQHLTFVEGLTLKLCFPSSSLILTPDFQAGAGTAVDREIHLRPTETPTLTLTRVDEPVTLIEQALLPAPDNTEPLAPEDMEIEQASEQVKAADELTRWDHQIPDEQAESEQPTTEIEPAAAIESAVETDQALDIAPVVPFEAPAAAEDHPDASTAVFEELSPPDAVQARARRSHRPLTGLIAAAALLAPMCLFLVEGQKLGIDFPLTNYRPLDTAGEPAVSGQQSPLAQPVRAETLPEKATPAALSPTPVTPAGPSTATPATEESTTPAEAPAPRVPEQQPSPADEQQRLLIASLLAEAKAFYTAGLIVTPIEANTVSHLTQVLSMDPTNEEGLRLMYMSAVTLIEEAEAAHAAGDNFLARNLVEDVLGFHPEFDDARALLDSWTRVPEG